MGFDPNKPYNDLPLLPPIANIETTQILKKAVTAVRSLAELKGLGDTIPNQSILINSIILKEAKASSEIENVITTEDALFEAFTASTDNIDPNTKEVLRYRVALWDGFNKLKNRPFLTTNIIVRIVQTLRKNDAGVRNTPGTKLKNAQTDEIVYTPPEGQNIILEKLKNLEDYINKETLLIR